MTKPFVLIPGKLSIKDFQQIYEGLSPTCVLIPEAIPAIHASQSVVQSIVDGQQTVYGINTGFGALASECIPKAKLAQLQRNLVVSHACGTGHYLNDRVVSLILIMKIASLAQGYSGVRLDVIEMLLALYNGGVFPCIPEKGSVGASGDLVPLAHLSLVLIGEGEVRMQGRIIPAIDGLNALGLKPIELAPKEGLALLNGMQVSCAMAMEALFVAERLFETALITGSLSVDAARGSDRPFDARIQRVRGHLAQADVAEQLMKLLRESEIRQSHKECERVQDPYSLRCQPQIMGAVLHQIRFVNETLGVEANAVSDNPLVFSEHNEIVSGGNFHGEIVAMACDNLALAIAEMGANAERRIALLIDRHFSGLPAFLVKEGGLNSGFMIAHVTAAACASDNKALAHPHCVDSLPTSANQEDHVSMATNAARRLAAMNDNTATILAIELLAACQGVDLLAPLRTSPFLEQVKEAVRAHVPFYETDRNFAPDIASAKEMVLSGKIIHSLSAKTTNAC